MITIRASYDQAGEGVKLYGTIEHEGERFGIDSLHTSGKHDRFSELPCFVTLDKEEAQGLFDSLYACGLRPTLAEPANPTHLEDMRKIVFALLKVPDGQ